MSEHKIQVAMCIDRGFTVPLAVALASLEAANPSDAIVVHVVHPGLAADEMARVTTGLSSVEVRWLLVADGSVAGAHHHGDLSSATLFRLRLGELLPAQVDRVIYLDADVLVQGSLAPLFATDLSGAVVSAVRDAGSRWAAGPMGMAWRQLGIEPSAPYFNAGVLVIDLEAWNEHSVGDRSIELLRGSALRWGDQDALNALLHGRWKEEAMRWNVQTGDFTGDSLNWAVAHDSVASAVADPAVVHFTGPSKPWHFGCSHPLTDAWFTNLDRTSWAGWRPGQPQEGIILAASRRAVRSIRGWQRGREAGRQW